MSTRDGLAGIGLYVLLRRLRPARLLGPALVLLVIAKVWWDGLPLWKRAVVLLALVALIVWLTHRRRPRRSAVPAAAAGPQRQPLDPDLRRAIIARDDSVCGICGFRVNDPADIHIDHIHPVHAGGTDDPANLQTAHADCNRRKGGIVGWQPPYRRQDQPR